MFKSRGRTEHQAEAPSVAKAGTCQSELMSLTRPQVGSPELCQCLHWACPCSSLETSWLQGFAPGCSGAKHWLSTGQQHWAGAGAAPMGQLGYKSCASAHPALCRAQGTECPRHNFSVSSQNLSTTWCFTTAESLPLCWSLLRRLAERVGVALKAG